METSTEVVDGKEVVVKKMTQSPAEIPARLRELGMFVLLGYLWATPLLLVGLWRSFADKRVGWVLLLIFLSNLIWRRKSIIKCRINRTSFFPAIW